ncbi:MAG: hypothetical protein ACK47B_04120 [Armatimonadota bacterium]
MFRKNLDPKVTAVVTLLVLGVIQYAYWRGLVYREPSGAAMAGGPGAGPVPIPTVGGHVDVDVTTLAGGEPGYVDGPGWAARFCGPNALAIAGDGTLLVSDSRNHRIRSVSPLGKVTTVAGGGEPGGQGGRSVGAAAEAQFRFPSGVAAAPDGTIYIADTGNHRICVLHDGVVSELAGGTEGKADGSGGAARFRLPSALLFQDDALWVADLGNRAIRRVTPAGQVSTPQPAPPHVAAAFGELLAARASSREVFAAPEGEGDFETSQFRTGRLSPIVPAGPVDLMTDTEFHTVLAKGGDGHYRLLAGRYQEAAKVPGSRDGTGTRATFAVPCAVTATTDGTVYVADYEGHRIRKLTLPDWLTGGGTPAERPRGAGRIWRGR